MIVGSDAFLKMAFTGMHICISACLYTARCTPAHTSHDQGLMAGSSESNKLLLGLGFLKRMEPVIVNEGDDAGKRFWYFSRH